jgi:hypothetical protein
MKPHVHATVEKMLEKWFLILKNTILDLFVSLLTHPKLHSLQTHVLNNSEQSTVWNSQYHAEHVLAYSHEENRRSELRLFAT